MYIKKKESIHLKISTLRKVRLNRKNNHNNNNALSSQMEVTKIKG